MRARTTRTMPKTTTNGVRMPPLSRFPRYAGMRRVSGGYYTSTTESVDACIRRLYSENVGREPEYIAGETAAQFEYGLGYWRNRERKAALIERVRVREAVAA